VHAFVENLVPRLAQRLRAVHRDARVAQKIFGTLPVGRAQHDADAHGRKNFVAVRPEGQRHLLLNAFGDAQRFGVILQVVQKDRELVPPEAGDGVSGAHAGFESQGDGDE